MTTKELYDRLLNNLEVALKAKAISRDPNKLADDIGAAAMSMGKVDANYSIEEGWISSTCYISLPGQLGRLIQMINRGSDTIKIEGDRLIPIEYYYEEIRAKESEIIELLDSIYGNEDLLFFDGHNMTPIHKLLQEDLDNFDVEVRRVENCYNQIIDSRK